MGRVTVGNEIHRHGQTCGAFAQELGEACPAGNGGKGSIQPFGIHPEPAGNRHRSRNVIRLADERDSPGIEDAGGAHNGVIGSQPGKVGNDFFIRYAQFHQRGPHVLRLIVISVAVVAGNDDAVKAIKLLVGVMADAIVEAKQGILEFAYTPDEGAEVTMEDVIVNVQEVAAENERRRKQRFEERKQQNNRNNQRRYNNRRNEQPKAEEAPAGEAPVVAEAVPAEEKVETQEETNE